MIEIFTGIAGLVGASVAALVSRQRGQDRVARWRERAGQCGLTGIEVGTLFPFRGFLTGRRGRHGVRVERFKKGKSHRGVRVVIDGLDARVGLKGEGLGSTIEKALGSRDIETGDALFDQGLYLRGEAPVLRALLDAQTRRVARELFSGYVRAQGPTPRPVSMSLWVAHGELRAEFADRFAAQDEPLADTLQALLALAERLAPVEGIVERLAAIARTDPVSRVRGHALAVLDQACARAPETDAAMSAALGDPDPEVRLLAALSRPEAGRPVLEELAALREAADWCSARAVEGLGEGLTLDAGRRALESARSAGKLKTAVAVILPVARAGGVEAVVSALADPSHAVATAAALALGAVNARDAEEALLKSLARPTDDFRVAAAHALGSIGTVRAVLPLKELERQGGAVSRAAREAVARIQAGLTGATPGQVSLSEADPSGNVSLAEDTGGRVTLASDGRTSKG